MYLYRATGDPTLLELGRDAVESIEKISKVECGFATVSVSGPLATLKPRWWLGVLERGGERLHTVKGERSGKTGKSDSGRQNRPSGERPAGSAGVRVQRPLTGWCSYRAGGWEHGRRLKSFFLACSLSLLGVSSEQTVQECWVTDKHPNWWPFCGAPGQGGPAYKAASPHYCSYWDCHS